MLHIDKNDFQFSAALGVHIYSYVPSTVFVFARNSYTSVPVDQMSGYMGRLPDACLKRLRYVVEGRMEFLYNLHNVQNGVEPDNDPDNDNMLRYALPLLCLRCILIITYHILECMRKDLQIFITPWTTRM